LLETKAKEYAWTSMIDNGRASLDFLIFNEIIQQQVREDQVRVYNVTKLGQGILKSNQAPEEGLLIYLDL